ncbi:MAG: hypothetical protein AB7F94_05655 [Nitrospira sp.]
MAGHYHSIQSLRGHPVVTGLGRLERPRQRDSGKTRFRRGHFPQHPHHYPLIKDQFEGLIVAIEILNNQKLMRGLR